MNRGALFVSFEPAVESPERPTARDIAAARAAWEQLKATKGATAAKRIRVDNAAIRGIAALASDATGYARFEGGIRRGVLSGKASDPFWLSRTMLLPWSTTAIFPRATVTGSMVR